MDDMDRMDEAAIFFSRGQCQDASCVIFPAPFVLFCRLAVLFKAQ
jgi:hypothetical protein